MQICILCPGPSLADLTTPPTADLTIGVNRAVLKFACDWWAALDYQTFTRDTPLGNPRLFTRAEYRHKTARTGIDAEDLFGLLPREKVNWPLYTSTASLLLAAYLGAKQIDVYGADWTLNSGDFDGVTPGDSRRNEHRWAVEMVIWSRLTNWLDEHGTTVKRHGTTRRSG